MCNVKFTVELNNHYNLKPKEKKTKTYILK